MKYTINFTLKKTGSYVELPINETVLENDGIGDSIGIYEDCLSFVDTIDMDNKEVREFIKTNFKDYRAVIGFIRKILE